MSGTSFSWSSNLYRPEYVLRKMSMSTAADMCAGSVLPTSSTMGKLSVWSEARFELPPPPPPPPQAATMATVPIATARERNTAIRLIPPPRNTASRRAHVQDLAFLEIHRPLPGDSRGESAPATDRCHPEMSGWPRYSMFSFELWLTEVKFR